MMAPSHQEWAAQVATPWYAARRDELGAMVVTAVALPPSERIFGTVVVGLACERTARAWSALPVPDGGDVALYTEQAAREAALFVDLARAMWRVCSATLPTSSVSSNRGCEAAPSTTQRCRRRTARWTAS